MSKTNRGRREGQLTFDSFLLCKCIIGNREIKCSIILNHAQARKIAEWLIGKADEYDSHFGGKSIDIPTT